MKRPAALLLFAALLLPLAALAGKDSKAVKPPRLLHSVAPEYTAAAEAAQVEGKVVLDLTVAPSGKVEKIEVVEPLSYGLTEAAIEAARQWIYEPPEGGTSVVVRITMKFEL